MTSFMSSTTTKAPKVNYKKQLRSEMMKSFNRFFSSSSPDNFDTTIKKLPGEEPVYDLKEHMTKLSTNSECSPETDGYDEEFEALTKFENSLARESNMFKSARLSKNSKKNKFSKVLPNEKTRVILSTKSSENDYINANLINASKLFGIKYRYIAAQAPISETYNDFWRMIFEQKSKIILMLAETEEEGDEAFASQSKCSRYWPLVGQDQKFGSFTVETVSQQFVNDIMIQEIQIYDADQNCHKVFMFQYVGWPDMSKPGETVSLHFLFERFEAIWARNSSMGPIVVHCSAGIGRTGTFITIHILLEQLKNLHKDNGTLFNYDVFNTVKELKTVRIGMVQRKEQYIFCYQALLDESERLKL
jgi:protein-tyrosine phosphatase